MKCRGCGVPLPELGAPVTIGRRHGFCTLRCRDAWAVDAVLRLEAILNSIYCRCRGRARDLAKHGLVSNLPHPAGEP